MRSLPLAMPALLAAVLALLASGLALTAGAPLAPMPAAHVFLIAGQSNAVGCNTDPYTAEDAVVDRIWQLQTCGDDGQLPISAMYLNVSSDPLQPCAGGGHVSFGRSFARSLLASLPAEDVVFLVPSGIGGTGFIDNTWTAYTGSGFKQSLAFLDQAWTLLHADKRWQRYNVTWDGILWHQGEDDAGDNYDGTPPYAATTAQYLHGDITPMIAAYRNTSLVAYSHATLPVVVGQLLPIWVSNSSWPTRAGVEVALALLPQYVGYTAIADSYGLQGDLLCRSGAAGHQIIHFTASSQRMFGKRYYLAYRQAQINYPDQPEAGGVRVGVEVAMSKKRLLERRSAVRLGGEW